MNRQEEELLTGGGREGGRWESEGLSAIGDRGQDAILLTSDADSTGSGSLLDSILCTFLKGLPRWLSHEETACHSGDTGDRGWIPGSGRHPGVGNGNPLQYSCLENPMDRGAWWATVHRVAKRQTCLKKLSYRMIQSYYQSTTALWN